MSPVKRLPLAIEASLCAPQSEPPVNNKDASRIARSGFFFFAWTLLALLLSFPANAQLSTNMQDIIRRIDSGEFSGNDFGGGRRGARGGGERHWIEGGRA